MAVTYTEQYETKKAFTEMTLSDGRYSIEYIATGEIGGAPDNVNGTIYILKEDSKTRIGYGMYSNGSTSVRFDSAATDVSNQAVIASQFYNDLQSILG